ncbi:MAG TPA: hypothetical protein PLJ39_02010 [Spirochaetota bacterium]|nr:hypothetical protein [Spirochaetota bacterium]HPN29483.1 hypothetical protein [bacterium]HPN29504.1 hypothetical protein [bacterium]
MIIVECFADEFFVKCLGVSRKKIKHEGGKGKVLGLVKKQNKAAGLVDEDPGSIQPAEMNNYIQVESSETAKLFRRNNNNSLKVVQVTPYLEGWLIYRAKQNGISPKNYDLPDDPKKMHSIPNIEKKPNFQAFVKEIVEKDSEVQTIKSWIEEAI